MKDIKAVSHVKFSQASRSSVQESNHVLLVGLRVFRDKSSFQGLLHPKTTQILTLLTGLKEICLIKLSIKPLENLQLATKLLSYCTQIG